MAQRGIAGLGGFIFVLVRTLVEHADAERKKSRPVRICQPPAVGFTTDCAAKVLPGGPIDSCPVHGLSRWQAQFVGKSGEYPYRSGQQRSQDRTETKSHSHDCRSSPCGEQNAGPHLPDVVAALGFLSDFVVKNRLRIKHGWRSGAAGKPADPTLQKGP